ncbi:hypothetical protein FQN54_005172 [Arachnomyces sp. PD_36]|nr:hypothetical protein FQN54_005172 [Arachnomyces sp. PD_36]
MPYTPPSQLSPSAHEADSTSGDGNSAFQFPIDQKNTQPESSSSAEQRPISNHHSFTSTSYFRRHRRSPSFGKSACLSSSSQAATNIPQKKQDHHAVDPHDSVKQSPPPVNDALIPTGAIISPPESICNSSDEEEDTVKRGKDKEIMAELQAAIQSIETTRKESSGTEKTEAPKEEQVRKENNKPNMSERPSLSKEARKISHSRSSSAASALGHQSTSSASSPEESDQDFEEAEITSRPPMVRKKSGELVRPALRPSTRRRPSSMPGTPVYSKAVHFDSHLEHIRHFLQLDKPLAVSAGSSPVEDFGNSTEFPFHKLPKSELEIRLPNFPHDQEARKHNVVRLERLFLSSDKKKLVGSVAVANLAYHKHVVARFTLDYWKTTSEVVAEYNHDVRKKHAHDGYDRFYFNIELTDQVNLEAKTMFLCVRYNTNGHEYWDNNNSTNYQVGFANKEVSNSPPPGAKPRPTPLGQSLPRSRGSLSSSGAARPKSMPPTHDDFVSGLKSNNFPDLPADKESKKAQLNLSPPHEDDILPEAPTRRSKPGAQAFGTRYDFGASLSAAIQSGGSQDRSVRMGKEVSKEPTPTFVKQTEQKVSPQPHRVTSISPPAISSAGAKPAALVSGKPHHQSSSYKELVDKYCFFETKPSPQPSNLSSQLKQEAPKGKDSSSHEISKTTDGACDFVDFSPRQEPSLPKSPSPPSAPPSPIPSMGSALGSRTTSPAPFAYPCHQPLHHEYFSDHHTPSPILG